MSAVLSWFLASRQISRNLVDLRHFSVSTLVLPYLKSAMHHFVLGVALLGSPLAHGLYAEQPGRFLSVGGVATAFIQHTSPLKKSDFRNLGLNFSQLENFAQETSLNPEVQIRSIPDKKLSDASCSAAARRYAVTLTAD